jgi:hypothetical protein
MMSRKNYIAVAKILASHRVVLMSPTTSPMDFEFLVNDFCTYFKLDNPNFSHDRFREACHSVPSDLLGRVNAQESDYE